jgi:hypothetical protein
MLNLKFVKDVLFEDKLELKVAIKKRNNLIPLALRATG